jgi:flavin reductase (DIM6/NTAB) family NADH-FMN oxidoreductase RutF
LIEIRFGHAICRDRWERITKSTQETSAMSSLPDSPAALDVATAFRDAMRRVASSVTLITTRDANGEPHGMAASAVIPVSMDPPAILVAVNRTSGLHPALSAQGRFCVNLLAGAHHPLLGAFSQSSRRGERFVTGDWQDSSDSLPCLTSALAAVSCEVDQRVEYATHTLFIGRVTAVQLAEGQSDPLVWFDGAGMAVSSRCKVAADQAVA